MHSTLLLLMDMTLMLSLAGILALICQRFKQPVVLGYIITGILVGPYTFPATFVHNMEQVKIFSELGVIFLMFATGLEFSFHELKEAGVAAIITGLIKVFLTIAVGITASSAWHWHLYQSIFFWSALSISSTTIIVKSLEDQGLKRKKFVELVLSLSIVEDLLAVIILTSLSTVMETQHLFSWDTLHATFKLFAIVGSWFVVGYFCMPWLFRKIIRYLNSEILTIISIALCLLLATIATYLNYSSALGAFIMGSILAEIPKLAKRIKQLILPMRDIFAAVFFLSVGMMIDIQSLRADFTLLLSFTILFSLCVTLFTSLGAMLTGSSLRHAVCSGLSMVPVGEFSFIIMGLGLSLGVVSNRLFQIVIGVSALTTFFSPYLISFSEKIAATLERQLPTKMMRSLEEYGRWVSTLLSSSAQQHTGLRAALKQLALNSVAIMAIFIASSSFLIPLLDDYLPLRHAGGLSWCLAMFCSIPFIREMIYMPNKLSAKHDVGNILLCWGLLLVELIILSAGVLGGLVSSITAVFSVAFVAIVARRELGQIYNHLVDKLSIWILKKQQQNGRYDVLALLDTPLTTCTVSNPQSILLGKSLQQLQLKQQYGVEITGIRRGVRMLLPPKKSDTLMLQDELMVLGNMADVTAFKGLLELPEEESAMDLAASSGQAAEAVTGADGFCLNSALLKEDDALVGKTVRNFNIAKRHELGIVMSIERSGIRILNPDPNTLLKEGDLLLTLSRKQR